jgi:hypothetical protein
MTNLMDEHHQIRLTMSSGVHAAVQLHLEKDGDGFVERMLEAGEKVLQKMKSILASGALSNADSATFDFEITRVQRQMGILKSYKFDDPFVFIAISDIMGTAQAVNSLEGRFHVKG